MPQKKKEKEAREKHIMKSLRIYVLQILLGPLNQGG
jgi:hypothetical protein